MSPMHRRTEQRAAIQGVLEDAEGPLSVSDIHERARAAVPALGLATVYRNVAKLVAEGLLAEVELPGESTRYERAHLSHHHHFHCGNCDRVIDVHHCATDFASSLPPGFVVERHHVTLYGRCADCS